MQAVPGQRRLRGGHSRAAPASAPADQGHAGGRECQAAPGGEDEGEG